MLPLVGLTRAKMVVWWHSKMKQRSHLHLLYRVPLMLVLLWGLVACQMPDVWQHLTPAPSGPPRGGTVTIAVPDALDAIQPWHVANRTQELFVSLTHAGLMRLDDRGMPQPELLADWQASGDQLVITATVKADLQWSNATPLTSADVVYTYSALKSLPVSSPLLADLAVISDVVAVDDTHVRFVLQRPYAGIFSLWTVPILPAQVLTSQQIAQVNMRNLLTSAGPFVYSEQREDGAIVLVANRAYVLGTPLLDSIVLRPAQTDAQMVDAVRTGTVDIAELRDDLRVQARSAISTTTYAQNVMMVEMYNMRDGHTTSDVRLRQVLAATMPYDVRDLFIPESWVHGVVTATQSITDAVALLDSTGWVAPADTTQRQRDGVPLAVSLLVPADNPFMMQHADVLEAQWQSWGITVTRQNADRDAYLQALIPPYAYDVMLVELAAGRSSSSYADLLFYQPDVRALFDASQRNEGLPDIRGSLNFSGLQDSTINSLLARLSSTYTNDAQQQLYRELIPAVQRVMPMVVRQRPVSTVIYGARVHASTGSMRFNSPWYSANAARWYVGTTTP